MKNKVFWGTVIALDILAGIIIIYVAKAYGNPSNVAQTDKSVSECTGQETQGGCTDKPYVPHTPTGCPYGDSIPVDSPKCAPTVDIPVPQEVFGK